jgi:hypothetical protein
MTKRYESHQHSLRAPSAGRIRSRTSFLAITVAWAGNLRARVDDRQ